jgi:cysteine sulfinate desulfinase/cysteine desulfurase-like protein
MLKDLEMLYLDYAASTPMRAEAVDAMLPFLRESFANPSGSHAAARSAKTALEEAREQVASALGADSSEVIFTGGGTESDNLAVSDWARNAGNNCARYHGCGGAHDGQRESVGSRRVIGARKVYQLSRSRSVA